MSETSETTEFNIAKFATEILERIFWHCDDTTANTISRNVCKRFYNVLGETVRRKYNGSSESKWYEIEIFDRSSENEFPAIVQHYPFILERVSAIKLTFHTAIDNRNHWINQVIQSIGENIRMIHLTTRMFDAQIGFNFYNMLSRTPNVTHFYAEYIYPTNRQWCHLRYRHLTHFEMRTRTISDEMKLKTFVKNNRMQLKNVKLVLSDFRLLFAFDNANIESLDCTFSFCTGIDIPVQIQPIRMTNLQSINLEVPNGALNECIEKIVAPCQDLKDLRLVSLDGDRDVLIDRTMDILCNFRSLKSFKPCFNMPLQDVVRLISKVPTLLSISLSCKTYTISDYKELLEVANWHPNLRHICFPQQMTNIYNHSPLIWLMENINHQIQLEHAWSRKLIISKGKVQYDGVTIMSTNESPIDYEKMTGDWLRRVECASIDEEAYEFFSNLPIPMVQTLFAEDSVLNLSDETNEAFVKRRGTDVTMALTKLSSNHEKSIEHINWLEKYCRRLQELTICTEDYYEHFPDWTFSELNTLRISSQRNHVLINLSLFASLDCLRLNALKIVGLSPFMLTNIQVVRDIDLFDNLTTLQIFHFNESTNQLLGQFNQNMQNNLRHLTLANRRVHLERYKMNNKTITALSKYKNLIELKLILPAINKTNTKYLFENCVKLTELSVECNFLTADDRASSSYDSYSMFAHIKSNCYTLRTLRLVWNDRMMDPRKVGEIKRLFRNVCVKIMQLDECMNTTAELIISDSDNGLERLFEEVEV